MPSLINKRRASTLWCMELSHQTLLYSEQMEGRLVIMDNNLTRHLLARQLNVLTDRVMKVLGTVFLNTLDAVNCPNIWKALNELQHAERGSW